MERIEEWRKSKSNKPLYNSWRGIKYTEKGKKIGCEWDTFELFNSDMESQYQEGYKLVRLDKSKPYSKDNCKYVPSDEVSLYKELTVLIEYDGKKLSFKEWAAIANTTIAAIKNRYYKHPEYSTQEIIYGKIKRRGSKVVKDASKDDIRTKASKMISAYKCKDKKNNTSICDLDIDWMIENIINKPCYYCGDTHRVGCDRIDNSKGHTKDNVVPCCYECNCARNNNFSVDEMKIIGKAIKEVKLNRN